MALDANLIHYSGNGKERYSTDAMELIISGRMTGM